MSSTASPHAECLLAGIIGPLQIDPDPPGVAPEPDQPGWIRITQGDSISLVPTHTVMAVREERGDHLTLAQVVLQGGYTIRCNGIGAGDVLAALREADADATGNRQPQEGDALDDAASAIPDTMRASLAAAVLQRRRQVAEISIPDLDFLTNGAAPKPHAHLTLLREHALALAEHGSHPRDFLLLLRDALHEAAVDLAAGGQVAAALQYVTLARRLEKDVPRLPAGRPVV